MMSMHKKPLTEQERLGLKLHGLDIGTPSLLSDCFRLGIEWANNNIDRSREIKLENDCAKLYGFLDQADSRITELEKELRELTK